MRRNMGLVGSKQQTFNHPYSFTPTLIHNDDDMAWRIHNPRREGAVALPVIRFRDGPLSFIISILLSLPYAIHASRGLISVDRDGPGQGYGLLDVVAARRVFYPVEHVE